MRQGVGTKKRISLPDMGLPFIYLKQAELHVSKKPETIMTILGSCIAVIMYETESGLYLISHCTLPGNVDFQAGEVDVKYVTHAIKRMLEVFSQKKIPRHKIRVKLFGGAEQLGNVNKTSQSVGQKNTTVALSMLEQEGIPIVSMDVGGNHGRKIYLITSTGDVFLSRIHNIHHAMPEIL
jgi:chemotaxis protein CheD